MQLVHLLYIFKTEENKTKNNTRVVGTRRAMSVYDTHEQIILRIFQTQNEVKCVNDFFFFLHRTNLFFFLVLHMSIIIAL